SRPRGRHPVALPHPRPSGHAVPVRGVVPDGARAVHPGAPDRRGRGASRPRLPVRPEHRPPPLPLARRHASSPPPRAPRPGRPAPGHPGTRYLCAEPFPTGRARFIPALQTAEAAELPDRAFPFVLNTGRLLYHWHGGTLTRRVQGLLELAPRLEVAIHPSDARRLGVDTGARIRVASRRGELTGPACVTAARRRGARCGP